MTLLPDEDAMGLFTKDIKTLEDLFSHGLKDIYYAENQILKALPKLIESATNPQLKKALKDHLGETKVQVSRLEQIFEMREEKPKGTKCPGINGLIGGRRAYWQYCGQEGRRCRDHCQRAGGRTLRIDPLWGSHRLGTGARTQ